MKKTALILATVAAVGAASIASKPAEARGGRGAAIGSRHLQPAHWRPVPMALTAPVTDMVMARAITARVMPMVRATVTATATMAVRATIAATATTNRG